MDLEGLHYNIELVVSDKRKERKRLERQVYSIDKVVSDASLFKVFHTMESLNDTVFESPEESDVFLFRRLGVSIERSLLHSTQPILLLPYLLKSDVLCILTEASSADIDAVFPNDSAGSSADATVGKPSSFTTMRH